MFLVFSLFFLILFLLFVFYKTRKAKIFILVLLSVLVILLIGWNVKVKTDISYIKDFLSNKYDDSFIFVNTKFVRNLNLNEGTALTYSHYYTGRVYYFKSKISGKSFITYINKVSDLFGRNTKKVIFDNYII